ncbi:RICIN domain-containing protein [Lentzea sp. NPDC058450]|uniref:RICIN domain-containing protein n=1 Tax=Lentzea sp. NPDC058450 TaxID=3346505 RepID=UPI00364AC053
MAFLQRVLVITAALFMVASLSTTAQAADGTITYVKRTGGEMAAQQAYFLKNINTGRCLAIRGAANYNGSPAFQHDCGFADQIWEIRYYGYDRWEVRNTFTGRCLSIRSADNYNGSPAFQLDCVPYADQHWFIVDAYDSIGRYLYSILINNVTGRCLAVRSAANYNGSPAFQHDCSPNYNDQQWKFQQA